ncbi:DoxX family protein [Opitutaceae bacterium EW11]|nr:DoxX family protein [Opitutaceae bacterium EW11]
MSLVQDSLATDLDSRPAAAGVFALRVGLGSMVFVVHGYHKLLGGLAFLRHGTHWPLAAEVAEMHVPFPIAAAFVATAVQLVCALLLALGLFTRFNAAVLTAVLGGAILQNLLAGRDPQLALLYTLGVAVFVLVGGGPFSCDARLRAHRR